MKYILFFAGIIMVQLFIGCHNKTVEKLSGNYFFKDYGLGRREIYPDNVKIKTNIYADVVDHAFGDSFILAKQIANFDNFKSSLGFDLYNRYCFYSEKIKNRRLINTDSSEPERKFNDIDGKNYMMFKERGASTTNSTNDIAIMDAVADSLLKHDPFYVSHFRGEQFYIISIARDSLFGPLSKSQYKIARKALGIPDNIKLESDSE